MLKEMFSSIPETIDQVSLDFLSKGLAQHQTEKFDYIKYRIAVNSLSQMNMEMETARQSTLTTATTMGITQQDILRSARDFIEILDEEEEVFSTALANQYKQKVSNKKEEVLQMRRQIEIWQQQVEEIKKKIEDAGKQIELEEKEISLNDQKIQVKKEQFENTLQWIKQKVQEDIDVLSNI